MLAFSPALAPLGEIAVLHHERLDGSGYPRGLQGNAIGPAARILAAADSYRAMTEERPHRSARPPDEAAAELRAEVSRAFAYTTGRPWPRPRLPSLSWSRIPGTVDPGNPVMVHAGTKCRPSMGMSPGVKAWLGRRASRYAGTSGMRTGWRLVEIVL